MRTCQALSITSANDLRRSRRYFEPIRNTRNGWNSSTGNKNMPTPITPAPIRFARFLSAPDTNGCILWKGRTKGFGYGTFWMRELRRGIPSHRAAWILAYGNIPDGMHVLHKCDVPACVNLDHLFLGTHSDNMADKASKGRCNTPCGYQVNSNKLTEDQVRYIRSSNKTNAELGRELGVWHTAVSKIRRRRLWKHIA